MDKQSSGPIFESGPGWGAKVKTWLGKYFYKIVLPIIIIALIVYGIAFRNRSDQNVENNPLETQWPQYFEGEISQIIEKGDGKVFVARKAIAQYFSLHSDESATPAQKMYLETILAKNINDRLIVGNTIIFYEADIQAELGNSKNLTPGQVQKWDAYARQAGVK